MHQEPITPGPRAPRHWVPLFLAQLAVSPDLEAAYRCGGTTEAKVTAMRQHSGYFDAAYRIILREHRRRACEAGLPEPPFPSDIFPATHAAATTKRPASRPPAPSTQAPVSTADLAQFVGNGHAAAAIFWADLDTLSLFCTRIAEAVGLDEIEGQPVVAWFMGERRAMLDRELLAIGDTNPALYEHLQRHLDPVRRQAGSKSIVQPPED